MKTVMSLKIDKDVKESAQEVASSLGLSLSALVNSYLRQVSATRHVEMYAPEPMTPKMEKIIAGIEAEIAAGKISKPFKNVDEFLADLKK